MAEITQGCLKREEENIKRPYIDMRKKRKKAVEPDGFEIGLGCIRFDCQVLSRSVD